jgi:ABC-2 type transport system ATP-binding protein
VAEGTPFELKRRIGNDVIFARLDGDAAGACPMVQAVAGVAGVEARGNEMVITAAEGTAVIGPVAVALNSCGIPVRDLTLRTPSLDDVFLELTGTHIQPSDEVLEAELAEMAESDSDSTEVSS